MNPTDSRLETAFLCRASTVLPQANEVSEYATHGKEWHAFLQRVVELQALPLTPGADGQAASRTEVLAAARHASAMLAPETLRDTMRAFPLEVLEDLDLDPATCAVEVAFSYDVATDTSREVGRGVERAYGELSETEYAGTADYVQLIGKDGGKVRDWKFLYSRRTAARDNPQIKKGALNLARAHGLAWVDVEIVRLDENGRPWFDRARLTAVDLDGFSFEMQDLHKRIQEDRKAYGDGFLPRCTITETGCRYCASARFCPAMSNLARSLVDPTTDITRIASKELVLTDPLIRDLIVALPVVKKRIEEVERAVKLYAMQTPVELPDGRVYGPRPDVKREIADVELAKQILTKRLGAAPAAAALSPAKMTMEGLESARVAYFKEHPEEKKKGAVGALDVEIEKLLHDAGALRKYDAPVVTAFKPKTKEA